MLLAAGEMDEVGPPRLWATEHEVHPTVAFGGQDDARLVRSGGDDLVSGRQPPERVDEGSRFLGRRQEVEVADRGSPSAQRPGRLDAIDPRHLSQSLHQLVGDPIGFVEQQALVGLPLETGDALEDVLLRSGRQPGDATDLSPLGGGSELLERGDAELEVQQPGGARPDPVDAEDADQAGRDLGPQPIVVLEVTGRRQLGQARADGRPHAGQLRVRPATTSGVRSVG